MKKINKNIWLKYLKTYEDFNKEIPSELKQLFSNIRNIIGIKTNSFKMDINLNDLNFCDNIIQLDVKYEEINSNKPYDELDIIYYSNINIADILYNKHELYMPVYIKDVNLNINKLISVISHEIRHIYDVYMVNDENDMKSFIKSNYYNILKKSENNQHFKNFLELVYLSLEHELIARNTMIYEMFMNCNCSKEELYKLFEKSYVYKSFKLLKNFKYDNLLQSDDILNKTNNFIKYFEGNSCKTEKDLINFYDGWIKYFNDKSDEYIIEAYKILDDVYNLTNENILYKKRNVKDILKQIYNDYIKQKN